MELELPPCPLAAEGATYSSRFHHMLPDKYLENLPCIQPDMTIHTRTPVDMLGLLVTHLRFLDYPSCEARSHSVMLS